MAAAREAAAAARRADALSCGACEGLGFVHSSAVAHTKRADERCWACSDCDVCRGAGVHSIVQ
eukprot:SAG11_NODE_1213_length_5506_cov_2.953579_4_plen_63_part_00